MNKYEYNTIQITITVVSRSTQVWPQRFLPLNSVVNKFGNIECCGDRINQIVSNMKDNYIRLASCDLDVGKKNVKTIGTPALTIHVFHSQVSSERGNAFLLKLWTCGTDDDYYKQDNGTNYVVICR